MAAKTVLFDAHIAAGARMVDFGGWDMPLHYGSQKEEHHAVRKHAGLFDVSHMTVIDLHGERVREFLRHLLANDVAKLTQPGKALYSCMLNETGGVIDDLIVYFNDESWFRLIVNAATRDKDLASLKRRFSDNCLSADIAIESLRRFCPAHACFATGRSRCLPFPVFLC